MVMWCPSGSPGRAAVARPPGRGLSRGVWNRGLRPALLERDRDRLEVAAHHVDAVGLELVERLLHVLVAVRRRRRLLGDDRLALLVLRAEGDVDRLLPR